MPYFHHTLVLISHWEMRCAPARARQALATLLLQPRFEVWRLRRTGPAELLRIAVMRDGRCELEIRSGAVDWTANELWTLEPLGLDRVSVTCRREADIPAGLWRPLRPLARAWIHRQGLRAARAAAAQLGKQLACVCSPAEHWSGRQT